MFRSPASEASSKREMAMDQFANKGPMRDRESIDSLLVSIPVNGLSDDFGPVVAFAKVG